MVDSIFYCTEKVQSEFECDTFFHGIPRVLNNFKTIYFKVTPYMIQEINFIK